MGSTSWPSPRVRTCTICIPTEPGCGCADASRPGLCERQRDRPVSRVLSRAEARGRSSIWSAGHPTAHAADPRARAARPVPGRWPRHALLLGLAPGRVCRVSLRRPKPPASSLWHWSSPRGGRGLPAALRCGARTFLTRGSLGARDRPAGSLPGSGDDWSDPTTEWSTARGLTGPGRRGPRASTHPYPSVRRPSHHRRLQRTPRQGRGSRFDSSSRRHTLVSGAGTCPKPPSCDPTRPPAAEAAHDPSTRTASTRDRQLPVRTKRTVDSARPAARCRRRCYEDGDPVEGGRRLGTPHARRPRGSPRRRTEHARRASRDGHTAGSGANRGQPHHGGRSALRHAIERLVRERVRLRVERPRDVRRRPAPEPAEDRLRRRPQRLQLGVLHPPSTVELLDDELGVEEQVDPVGTQLAGELERADDARPLGDVVRLEGRALRRSWRRAARAGRARPRERRRSAARPVMPVPGCRGPHRPSGSRSDVPRPRRGVARGLVTPERHALGPRHARRARTSSALRRHRELA